MDHTEVKGQIISIAKDKFNHQCFPTSSGKIGTQRAFRLPDDRQPLGFNFHGVSIEVHVTGYRNVLIADGCNIMRSIPVLLVLGIRSDGMIKVIAKGVLAHD